MSDSVSANHPGASPFFKPWYFSSTGWRRFFRPRFVLPSRRQILHTAVIHFALGSAALLVNVLRAPFQRKKRLPPANILFIGRYHLGDFLMTLPAIQLARDHLPSARMTTVIQERYRDQLDLSQLQLKTIREIDGLDFWRELQAWRTRLREGGYDAVVFHRITRPDFPAILAAFLENIPQRIGGAEKGLQGFLTDVYYPIGRELVVGYHWNLVCSWLRLQTSTPELHWPELVPETSHGKQWDLLIAPFAQHTKEWPSEYWHTLLHEARKRQSTVALSASPAQSGRAKELLASFPEVENLASDSTAMANLFDHVKRSRCVIAVDTGIRHVAAALGVPCVVLGHGREHYRLFGAYVPTERYLFHPVPCAPCGAEPCPLGHLQCIRGIAPASVMQAWDELINLRA